MSIVEKAAERLRADEARHPARSRETASTVKSKPKAARTTVERLDEGRESSEVVVAAEPLQVGWERVRRAGYLPDGEASERLRDELRRIKRRLLGKVEQSSAVGRNQGRRIMVTSALVGEGKTFTAINLAVSLANERDLEILLIDADIPKSDLTRLLGLESRPGLTDALADEGHRVDDLIIPTQTPNLMVLPAGQYHEMSAELLNSRQMRQVVQELQDGDQRRILLFDSAPLLLAADAPVLAGHMDQILLVVAADRTLQQAVKAALETLDGAESISLVLNMARLPSGEGYYDRYGYRYQKGR